MTPKGYGPQGAKPLEMRAQPNDYQLQGLQWLSLPNPAGKILANDMGLGKTLQALATAAALANRPNGARQVLVVVPCQVLRNRFNETNKVHNPDTHSHSMATVRHMTYTLTMLLGRPSPSQPSASWSSCTAQRRLG